MMRYPDLVELDPEILPRVAQNPVRRPAWNPARTKVIAVHVPKSKFAYGAAAAWVRDHGFNTDSYRASKNFHRFAQTPTATGFASVFTKVLPNGIQFIFGVLPRSNPARAGGNPAFIRTRADEQLWTRAVQRAREQYGEPVNYAFANWLFHRMKQGHER